eukprot:Nk52_evm5s442 gene=Nk52_evmTU5s442
MGCQSSKPVNANGPAKRSMSRGAKTSVKKGKSKEEPKEVVPEALTFDAPPVRKKSSIKPGTGNNPNLEKEAKKIEEQQQQLADEGPEDPEGPDGN